MRLTWQQELRVALDRFGQRGAGRLLRSLDDVYRKVIVTLI